ncbi:MAG: sensor histidine kinase [Frankia sp.]
MGSWIPHGRSLPAQDWASRHRLVTWVLALHLPAIVLYAYVQGFPVEHGVVAAIPAALLLSAAVVPGARRVRALSASLGLFCCSAALVHLSHGVIEMHFHFFVVVGLVSLYEDWIIHLAAVCFVGVEVALLAGVARDQVYRQGSAAWNTWTVAAVNAGFVLALALAQLIFWHHNEQSRRRVEQYREQLYEGQQSLMARLEETDRIRSDLVATVSHEFRTPLTGIRASLLILRRRRNRLSDAQVDDMLDSAVSNTDRLGRLLENMLTAATATGTDDSTTADLPEVVAEVISVLSYSPGAANITVDLPAELLVRMARQALHQVVANLVDNALVHSWPGAPVRLTGGRVGDEVVLRVRNPGPDLDPATIRQLFEPFTQRDNSATRLTEGAGMGLYVVRRLVEVHGGRLRMASENGEIIVEVDLWAAAPRPAAAPAPAPRGRAVAPPTSQRRHQPTTLTGHDVPPGLTASSSG